MSYDEYNLFESAIDITEERDKKSLEKVLVDRLSDFIDFDTLILLRVLRSSEGEYLEMAAFMPMDVIQDKLQNIPHEYGDQRVQGDDSIALCIDRCETVSEELNGKKRILFPIAVNDVVTGILDIYGHDQTTNTEKLIRGFIRIYSNFLAIIDDNERDTLTGLLNRKTFDAQLSDIFLVNGEENNALSFTEERRSVKNDIYHWVGILDVDHFKSINDNFGHVYGDEVLLLFADLMKKTFRSNDLLFRYGGEEFVVVLAPATEADAFMVFERFRQDLELFKFPQVGQVTVSVGMVKVYQAEHSATVLEHADQALYYAKDNGRNQTYNYNKLIKEGILEKRDTKGDIELF